MLSMLLFHANYQNMTMELRTGSPESKLSPTLPGCSVLYPVLQVMVNENSDAAWMDGWMDGYPGGAATKKLCLQN